MQNLFARPFSACLTIGAFVFALVPSLSAQLPTMSGGTRVRLAITEPAVTVQGTVFSQSADTLLLAGDGGVRAVPVARIAHVSVGGERSHSAGAWRGAKLGALIFGGVGLAAFGASSSSVDEPHAAGDLVGLVTASALSGAFYGAIIGAAVGAETWTPVYDSRLSMSVSSPRDGSRKIGLSLKF
jgi:hypothetical protein